MSLRRMARRWVLGCVLAPLALSVGCADEETTKAIDGFRKASGALAASYRTFLLGANEVEEEDAINDLVIRRAPFDEKVVAGRHLYSAEQIALREKAIKAAAAYTATLAELASGKDAAQVETDAKAASTQVATLGADAQTALKSLPGVSADVLAGPLSTAMAAAGSVLKLVEERKARTAIRASVMANDEAVEKLFERMEVESEGLYQRDKQTLGLEEDAVVKAFNVEAARGQGADGARLLELGDRLKQVRRRVVLQSRADPSSAIKKFKKAHDALIAAVNGGDGGKKKTLAELIAEAKSFADEVEPLAGNVQAFVASF